MPNVYNSWRAGIQIDNIYPVGSIYMSVNNVNPGTLFGGTWERIQDKFLLCAGSTYTAGTTGGSATSGGPSTNTSGTPSTNTSGSTAITIAQMPSHNHGSAGDHAHSIPYRNIQGITIVDSGYWMTDPGTVQGYNGATGSAGGHTHTSQGSGQGHTHTLSSHTHTLSSHTHSCLPPYLAVYVWQRIS